MILEEVFVMRLVFPCLGRVRVGVCLVDVAANFLFVSNAVGHRFRPFYMCFHQRWKHGQVYAQVVERGGYLDNDRDGRITHALLTPLPTIDYQVF